MLIHTLFSIILIKQNCHDLKHTRKKNLTARKLFVKFVVKSTELLRLWMRYTLLSFVKVCVSH
jgi:hypothetical protein